MARPFLVVGTPCFGGLVTHTYTLSICKLIRAAAERGIAVELDLLAHDALITRSRAMVVANFLDRPHATHLLFVDADIAFEPEQVFRLLEVDREFAAAFYPVKTVDWDAIPRRVVGGEPLRAAGLTYVGSLCTGAEAEREHEFATALYAGTGFQLIQRSVFERMIAAHPELRFRKVHALTRFSSDNLYALFDCIIDPVTGDYLSEDYSFCQRWRALGGKIWLDLRSRLTHTGAQPFQGDTTLRYRDPPQP